MKFSTKADPMTTDLMYTGFYTVMVGGVMDLLAMLWLLVQLPQFAWHWHS